ncbi:DNA polymerase III subunit delta [Paenibacillus baekrokdamisoli]|uniref:DNA polymerase III subunit delta n=1 Tax=Paenibacillus baekrokdamisoli TaxID=1712516 RepID=A0A3G9JBR9_9BACL|nr:DNA polymerase III subunit delta [Paenibacillus baekrokdamisoli]MBB3070323.1 DNA polymerase-3 subunit delta [Paenibacillus baekrokdamisoli]BBH21328.1 DNA polymerase III subunit delta [Paenibacillus baekrokdamisoli]
MEMKEAIKEWKAGKFRPVYVLYGKDRYRMRQFLSTLISMLLPEDERELGIVKFDTSETAIEEAVAEADTLPFFASRKLVSIRDQSVLAAAQGKEGKIDHQTDRLLAYLQQPCESSVIVFQVMADKLDERRKVVKLLKDQDALIPFQELQENELREWTIKRVEEQGREMSREAAELLLSRTGTNMQQLAHEVDKLCLHAGVGGTIRPIDVEQLIASTVEEDVFALIDSMASQQVDKALKLYRELLLRREEPIKIAALMARQLRIMLQIKELERHHYSPQQMAGQLGLHPYAVKLAAEKAKRLSVQVLGGHLNRLAELDYKMKTGQVDKTLGLELFLLSVAT